MSITYQRDVDRLLEPGEVDDNFLGIDQRIVALETTRPQPNNMVSATQNGLAFSINLADGAILGPINIPVVSFQFYEAWTPFTIYAELDTFVVDGVGIFTTMLAHTTGAEFDRALLVDGNPAYRLLFGFAPDGGSSAIYDIVIPYQGRLSDMTQPIVIPILHPIRIPAIGAHIARLSEPASTADQVLPLFHNATQIGTVSWLIGQEIGAMVFTADELIGAGEFFSIGLPAVADATAAGMSLGVAAQRVI
jgi:hypothetical protein